MSFDFSKQEESFLLDTYQLSQRQDIHTHFAHDNIDENHRMNPINDNVEI